MPVKFPRFLPLFLAAPAAAAFTPVLQRVEPAGGARGQEMELHFHGERLEAVRELMLYQPGLEVRTLEAREPGHVVATLGIAPDAALGEHSLRLRTSGGISELRSFWVGQFPAVDEVEPNNSFDEAQRVELNRTVHGVAENEDQDLFVVALRAGQRLSVEVEAMRLGRTMFDAHVAVLDPRGFEIASCDDVPLLRTDAFVSLIAPEDGDYRVVLREAAYEGNANCHYRLHIGTFPRPSGVFPIGAKPGETLSFTFLGDPSGPIERELTIPADAAGSHPLFVEQDGAFAPSPNWIQVSPLEHVSAAGGIGNRNQALEMPPIPSAAHGVLAEAGRADWFRFEAAKDDNLVLRVLARELRSPLDSVLSVHDANGRQLASNDDAGGPDSLIQWTCPEDGSYLLRVRDQLRRGGDDYSYRVEVLRREPAIRASLPTVERVNSQKWKVFPVPAGNRYAAVVNVARENLGADLRFEADSLPSGITLHAPDIHRSVNSVPVVFEALPGTPPAGGLHGFRVRVEDDGNPLAGALLDTIHHVDVNNQGAYHSVTLDRVATAVVDPVPFRIELEEPAVPIVQHGSLGLRVRAIRDEGYAENITVRFLWSPPGISGPVTLEMAGDQSELTYEINAAADASAGDWPVVMLAEAETPAGPVLVSSSLATLRVLEPMVAMQLDIAAAEQGGASAMAGKIEVLEAFEGEAVAELIGLPHGVSASPQTFSAEQTEILFPLELAEDAAIGRHASIFCRIRVPQGGQTLLHQTAHGSTLRIDRPAAPVAAAEGAPPPPEPEPGERPLSRLEQLRRQQQVGP